MAAMKQGINSALVAVIGLNAALILVMVIFGVQAWYFWQTDTITAEKYQNARDRDLARVTAEQTENLTRVGYADESRTALAVPIDRAMDLWLAENAQPGAAPAANGGTAGPDAAAGEADSVTPVEN